MKILNIIIYLYSLYVIFYALREVYILDKDYQKGKFVEDSHMHSLQHISMCLGGILVMLPLFFSDNIYGLFIYGMYFYLVLINHIKGEREQNFKVIGKI